MGVGHWYNVYEMSIQNPETIIEILVDSQQVRINHIPGRQR